MKNAIVTCATPSWLAPAAVTLLSCTLFKLDQNTELIIVLPEPTAKHFDELNIFNAKHNTNIKMLSTETTEFQKIETKQFSIAALLRLKLDKVLQSDYDRVLYLDSDVLAGSSCMELITANLAEHPLGAVEDIGSLPWISKKGSGIKNRIGMELELPYFNSGVLLFDWQQILEREFLAKCRTVLEKRVDWPFVDQDVLNLCFAKNWQQLHPKWNIEKKIFGYGFLKPGIRHFTGGQKPWNSPHRIGNKKYHKFYVDSLKDTPWSTFISPQKRAWPLRPNLLHIIRKLSFLTRRRLIKHFNKTTNQ